MPLLPKRRYFSNAGIYFELAVDTARLAVSKGLKNVFVSNGYMTEECLKDIFPDLHAANVDLKAFSQSFYKEQCGAKLEPVLKTLELMKKMGVWLEVTTLLIPGLNDSDEELKEISQFLANLDPNIPWHISRFHPTYRLSSIHSTSPDTIYSGNLPGDTGEKTFCHKCGELLIDRFGFNVIKNTIEENHCPKCSSEIPGVWTY